MGFVVSDDGGDAKEKVSGGMHQAVCCSVVDLGTQETSWEGVTKKQRKVNITWEIPAERARGTNKETGIEFDVPKLIGRKFTASLGSKAALRKILKSWRGCDFTAEELSGFEMKDLLGANCMINVVHTEDGKYANIESVVPLMKSMQKLQPENQTFIYSIQEDGLSFPEQMMPWMKDAIMKSEEMKGMQDAASPAGETASTIAPIEDDDVPF